MYLNIITLLTGKTFKVSILVLLCIIFLIFYGRGTNFGIRVHRVGVFLIYELIGFTELILIFPVFFSGGGFYTLFAFGTDFAKSLYNFAVVQIDNFALITIDNKVDPLLD